jgi:hypothetical protein
VIQHWKVQQPNSFLHFPGLLAFGLSTARMGVFPTVDCPLPMVKSSDDPKKKQLTLSQIKVSFALSYSELNLIDGF